MTHINNMVKIEYSIYNDGNAPKMLRKAISSKETEIIKEVDSRYFYC